MVDERKVAEDVEEVEEEAPGKSKTKLIIIFALVILIGGGAAGYFFFGQKFIQKLTGKEVTQTQGEGATGEAAKEETKKTEVVGPILALNPFVFNISGSQSRYAKITIELELKDARIMEEAKKMTPVIRDKVLTIFSVKTPEALMDVNQRNTIKTEIQTALKPFFKEEGELKGVYITDIIIQ